MNVFDTYHAAKTLKYPALSLAHLLKYHGNIKLNKKHQLSDWRQRPLPQDMIDYARTDTAYLHFLYDSMRKDVYKMHGQEGLQAVLNASRKWCFKRYEKELFWPLGFRKLLSAEGCHPHGGGGSGSKGVSGCGGGGKGGAGGSGSGGSGGESSGSRGAAQTLSAEQDLVLAGEE